MNLIKPFDLSCFYLRRALCINPALFISSAVCVALFATITVVYLAQANSAAAFREPLTAAARGQSRPTPAKTAALDLPYFHTVPLVAAIERASQKAGVEVDEVTFALEDTPAQPFLRYRASFTLIGRYRSIRDFVEQVGTTLNYISLDSIHCQRDDISEIDLGCTVTMSAVYRRTSHE